MYAEYKAINRIKSKEKGAAKNACEPRVGYRETSFIFAAQVNDTRIAITRQRIQNNTYTIRSYATIR